MAESSESSIRNVPECFPKWFAFDASKWIGKMPKCEKYVLVFVARHVRSKGAVLRSFSELLPPKRFRTNETRSQINFESILNKESVSNGMKSARKGQSLPAVQRIRKFPACDTRI
jgi:hypothetical protein